jgi:hypothetical protein
MKAQKRLESRIRGWLPEEIGKSRKQISSNQTYKSISKDGLRSRNFYISCILASFVGAFAVDYFLGFLQSTSIITSSIFQTTIVLVFVIMLAIWGWVILQRATKGSSKRPD